MMADMLSAEDRHVVAHEPELPGLRVVLDPDVFAELLTPELADARIESARVVYLRYKPRTSCLGAYRMWVRGRAVDVYAKALRPVDAHRLGKPDSKLRPSAIGPARLVFEDIGLCVHVYPNDRKLRSLRRLESGEGRARILRGAVPERPELWNANVVRLAYKPERRFVAQLKAGTRALASAKMHRRGAPAVLAGLDSLVESSEALRLPRLLGRSERHGLAVWEWLDGDLLRGVLAGPEASAQPLYLTGRALAELHLSNSVENGDTKTLSEHRVAQVRRARAALESLHPRLHASARRIGTRVLCGLLERTTMPNRIHGDFYSKQVVVDGGCVGFIDLDAVRPGEPEEDSPTSSPTWTATRSAGDCLRPWCPSGARLSSRGIARLADESTTNGWRSSDRGAF